MLKINSKAPNFELKDQEGNIHNLSDYKGKFVLIYFYPKDDTPGCTKEACSIRDAYGEFKKEGIVVFGISKDTVGSHKKFVEKYKLPFTLLSDTDKKVITAYGAKNEPIGTKRISYLIDEEGKIAKAYPTVSPEDHADEILRDFKALK